MSEFDDIRPYHDQEVSGVLSRLLENDEFVSLIGKFRAPGWSRVFPALLNWRIRRVLSAETRGVNSVADFQKVVSHYVNKLLESSTTSYSYEGVDKLDKDQGYLFVGNHRDIAADSMLLDYALFYSGYDTVRIAIGDNLLQRDFATDLMRLNKSFIIRRSAEGAKKIYAALMQSSKYINASIAEGQSIWIAQSEGRAKNGLDITDPAIVKMFVLSQRKFGGTFSELIRTLRIVPVTIAYEYDPCDQLKARELYHLEKDGNYIKPEGEDLISLVKGLTEFKGRIRLVVGTPLHGEFNTPEDVARAIDDQILRGYRLFPSNYIALSRLTEEPYRRLWLKYSEDFSTRFNQTDRDLFQSRLHNCPEEQQTILLRMYANPLLNIETRTPEVFQQQMSGVQ